MKTSADFLRESSNFLRGLADWEHTLSRDVRERLREIAQAMDDDRDIIEAVAELKARVGAIAARRPSVAPSSSPPPEFTLPPVDPLEAITPTYQPDVPPSPPAQEGL